MMNKINSITGIAAPNYYKSKIASCKLIKNIPFRFFFFITFLFVAVIANQSCGLLVLSKTKPSSRLHYSQDGKEYVIEEKVNAEIDIKKAPFSLHFTFPRFQDTKISDCSVQLAAVTNQIIMQKIHTNMPISQSSFFSVGTGMAAPRYGGYEFLLIRDDAHHYLVFDGNDSKRLTPIEESEGHFKLAFDIDKLFFNNTEVPIADTSLNTLYLVIFINDNNNDLIEEGELIKLTVRLN